MPRAAVRQTGQKANSGCYSQHQERTVFDFIRQFSECVTTEALGFIGDRLAHAGRAFSYAAHDAIQSIANEFTDVIRGAGRFALCRTRQAAKPLLKVAHKLLDCRHFFRSRSFCTSGHFAPETSDFVV